MVAVLVGDDVPLGERAALGVEPRMELVEEAQIDVDGHVGRAVERSDLGRRRAAAGVDAVREDDRLGRLIGLALLRELVLPVRLDAVDEADDPAVRALVRLGAGLAFLCRLRADRAVRGTTAGWGEVGGVAAEQQVDDGDDEPDPAAADREPAAAAVRAAPNVGDLVRVQLCP